MTGIVESFAVKLPEECTQVACIAAGLLRVFFQVLPLVGDAEWLLTKLALSSLALIAQRRSRADAGTGYNAQAAMLQQTFGDVEIKVDVPVMINLFAESENWNT